MSTLARTCTFLGIATSSLAWGLPSAPNVLNGAAEFIYRDPHTLVIRAEEKTMIMWEEFNVDPAEAILFIQPSSDSALVLRVSGDLPAKVLGKIETNGKLFIVSPAGIQIGIEGTIHTSGFLGASLPVCCPYALLNPGEEAFFQGVSTEPIVNLGDIRATNEDVFLVGSKVENKGKIEAPQGTIYLAAGQDIIYQPNESDKIEVQYSQSDEKIHPIGINNEGAIIGLGVECKTNSNAFAIDIQHTGWIQTQGRDVVFHAPLGEKEIVGIIRTRKI